MKRTLLVRHRAEVQASRARDWYEVQLEGLGHRFLTELDHAIQRAHENPFHYQVVHRETRRGVPADRDPRKRGLRPLNTNR